MDTEIQNINKELQNIVNKRVNKMIILMMNKFINNDKWFDDMIIFLCDRQNISITKLLFELCDRQSINMSRYVIIDGYPIYGYICRFCVNKYFVEAVFDDIFLKQAYTQINWCDMAEGLWYDIFANDNLDEDMIICALTKYKNLNDCTNLNNLAHLIIGRMCDMVINYKNEQPKNYVKYSSLIPITLKYIHNLFKTSVNDIKKVFELCDVTEENLNTFKSLNIFGDHVLTQQLFEYNI